MMEMVTLDLGRSPDWQSAEGYIDSLIIEEVSDELLRMCRIDTEAEAPGQWIDLVRQRLRSDLARFREDVETDRDEIEVWELEDAHLFVSIGTPADESDPDKSHGWLCRLRDSGALAAAGFKQARKAELYPLG